VHQNRVRQLLENVTVLQVFGVTIILDDRGFFLVKKNIKGKCQPPAFSRRLAAVTGIGIPGSDPGGQKEMIPRKKLFVDDDDAVLSLEFRLVRNV
jgi:hypothetical protein